jgi:hypothetical protein
MPTVSTVLPAADACAIVLLSPNAISGHGQASAARHPIRPDIRTLTTAPPTTHTPTFQAGRSCYFCQYPFWVSRECDVTMARGRRGSGLKWCRCLRTSPALNPPASVSLTRSCHDLTRTAGDTLDPRLARVNATSEGSGLPGRRPRLGVLGAFPLRGQRIPTCRRLATFRRGSAGLKELNRD